MRTGLDFAWSKPSVADILAGGYTFVLRYLSYDTTGKNLTRAEADTYRAAGIDICSNWEYTASAALGGWARGVKDATEAQRQHLDCGGDPAAPIYFSYDFDETSAQWPAGDAYSKGVASVLGLARTGAYGGYRTVKHLFDAGLVTWGWQTYAWSAGLWDPRAQLRQVQNGITVGGADCDRNEAHADNFGQWNRPSKEDEMRLLRYGVDIYRADGRDPVSGHEILTKLTGEEWAEFSGAGYTFTQATHATPDWNVWVDGATLAPPSGGGGVPGPSAAQIATATVDEMHNRLAG